MLIEVSNGEIIDKISILLIKMDRIKEQSKIHNITTEYQILLATAKENGLLASTSDLNDLKRINEEIWEAEERVRLTSDPIEIKGLTEIIYKRNDERAVSKKKINKETGSLIVEEKSYKGM